MITLALGAVAALAGIAALSGRRGSAGLLGFHLSDLPPDMHELVFYGLRDAGLSAGEAEDLMKAEPPLHVELRALDGVWPEIRRSFKGRDRAGVPIDLWAEEHWDYRGPPHVEQLRRYLELLLPTPAARRDAAQIQARLLGGDAAPIWTKRTPARVWEDADRDADPVVSLRPRSPSDPPSWAFNLPPALFAGPTFVDGRHRIFAARMAGLSHFPVVDLLELSRRP